MHEIIDSHVHLGTGGVALGPRGTQRSLALWKARASTAGIHRAVLMAAPVGSYTSANLEVARVAAADPGRWLWYVFINPIRDRGRIQQIVAANAALGACGIKVHWSDAPVTDEIAQAAAHHRMPVLYDPGGHVQHVAQLAERHRQVTWIVPHLSSFADKWTAQKALIELLVRLPNVFTDTAGVRYFDLLTEAITRAGAHKVLFGSDGPYLHPAPELAKVKALRLPPDEQQLVLRGNILRLTRAARYAFKEEKR